MNGSDPTPAWAADRADAVLEEVERVVMGKRPQIELVLAALLSGGHVLLEDVPGVAKTLLTRTLATATGLVFRRVQFTPDLLPSDITGSSMFDPAERAFAFHPGPVFANLVLGDEINRAPPKTQAALLEAMQEAQVTADGTTRPLPRPFLVVATQNPIEFEGTYPLPEAQLDRFAVQVSLGYPAAEVEWRVLEARLARRRAEAEVHPAVDAEEFLAMQQAVEGVHVDDDVGRYVVALTAATRSHPGAELGASPRGSLALMGAARGRALLAHRDFVTPDDVKAMAPAALGHRVRVRADRWIRGVRGVDVVRDCLADVPTPSAVAGDADDVTGRPSVAGAARATGDGGVADP